MKKMTRLAVAELTSVELIARATLLTKGENGAFTQTVPALNFALKMDSRCAAMLYCFSTL